MLRLLLVPAVAIALSFATGGCAGPGLPLDEVTEEPIALVYWDATTARKRQELIEQLEAGNQTTITREGVARLDTVADLVGIGSASPTALRLQQFPGRIVLLNPRTLEITPFPAAPPNARPLAWSRDRTRLLFNSSHQDGGRSQLYEYDLRSGQTVKLTHGPEYHLEGDYGPDDRLLVTWVKLSKDRQLAGMDIRPPAGGIPTPIIDGVYPSTPHWSADGQRILYVEADNANSRRDRSSVVVRPPVEGAEGTVVARGREAVFTPDGEGIVYATQTAAGWRLRRLRADGSGRAPLGKGTHDERWPAVSPDGRHVVYLSSEAGYEQLYIRRLDGSGDRILLADGSAAFPVW